MCSAMAGPSLGEDWPTGVWLLEAFAAAAVAWFAARPSDPECDFLIGISIPAKAGAAAKGSQGSHAKPTVDGRVPAAAPPSVVPNELEPS